LYTCIYLYEHNIILNVYYFSVYDNNTENERVEVFLKFVNEVASFSYDNVQMFEQFSEYDWLPKDKFKDLAYQVIFRSILLQIGYYRCNY